MDRSLQSHWEAGVGATRHLYGAHFHPARDNLLLLELKKKEAPLGLARSRFNWDGGACGEKCGYIGLRLRWPQLPWTDRRPHTEPGKRRGPILREIASSSLWDHSLAGPWSYSLTGGLPLIATVFTEHV